MNNNYSNFLGKINHKVKYKINESVRYTPVNGSDEFDTIPEYTNEVEEPNNKENVNDTNLEQTNDNDTQNVDSESSEDANTPTPSFDADVNQNNQISDTETSLDVNIIQNDIIRHNIETMKGIHSQLESLNGIVSTLNNKLNQLSSNVDEVREPTDGEKLAAKKDVSYPYYFNLNDFWKGNFFSSKYDNMKSNVDKMNSSGIRELPDGTFIADFDDLPHKSSTDLIKSFN